VPTATVGWYATELPSLHPALVEIRPRGDGPRFPLDQPSLWLGRDLRACPLAVEDDPFLDARHARFYQDGRGSWFVESKGTLNGAWLRIRSIHVEGTCQFQVGEQRFVLRIA
jgi:hypothetical protein